MKRISRIFFLFFLLVLTRQSPAFGTTYDCFLFFNELDMLDVRLHEMGPYIDKFILVESVETFSGKDKPLYYMENKGRYEEFQDKIIHIVVEKQAFSNPWDRESFQRNQIMRGLQEAALDDIIFISDLDEIVRGKKIPLIAQEVPRRGFSACMQSLHTFHLNTYAGTPWYGTKVMPYFWLLANSPQKTRHAYRPSEIFIFADAGWHFSWIGGKEANIAKLESFSHQEYNLSEYKSDEALQRGLNLHEWNFTQVDDRFPSYIVDNIAYFEKKGFILSELEARSLGSRIQFENRPLIFKMCLECAPL